MDNLFGGKGDDTLYGMEGSDYIIGGDGVDAIFGASGDDVIMTGYGATFPSDNATDPFGTGMPLMPPPTVGDGDFASGGSGNDRIYGDQF